MKNMLDEYQFKGWRKKLYWVLPLFFLIKGLLWLAVPFVSVVVLM